MQNPKIRDPNKPNLLEGYVLEAAGAFKDTINQYKGVLASAEGSYPDKECNK